MPPPDTPRPFPSRGTRNQLCLKKRFRPSSDLITRLKGGNHGGNGGCTNNLRTFPGLLAPFCWTDYGSGTGAGLIVRAGYRIG